LRVEDPVAAAKVIRPRGGTGFEECPFEVREPEVSLAGGKRYLFDLFEKGVLVCDERDRMRLARGERAAFLSR
jgi:hypothetical protein